MMTFHSDYRLMYILIIATCLITIIVVKIDTPRIYEVVTNSLSCSTPSTENIYVFEEAIKGPVQIDLKQDDPRIIQLIRDKYLIAPSKLDYNLSYPQAEDTSEGQTSIIKELLGDLRGGFFLEVGANDGEFFSNSLYFERSLGWTGILIEAGPKLFQDLQYKHRKSWSMNSCISLVPYPVNVVFYESNGTGAWSGIGAITDHEQETGKNEHWTQCFPFYSILLALNTTTVDFMSLDIQGGEYEVLTTIPWDKVNIRVMTVEYTLDAVGRDFMRSYIESKGYEFVQYFGGDDFIFKKIETNS